MLVREILSLDMVFIADRAESAAQIIGKLTAELSQSLGVDPATMERAVMERERARTTAFSNGAAIPHCRLPGLPRFGGAMLILREPVAWDQDRRMVDTVIMIAGPSDHISDHLRILANSSQLLDSRAVRAKLRSAPDPASAYLVMDVAEKAVEQRRANEGMLREVRKDEERVTPSDYLAEAVSQFNW